MESHPSEPLAGIVQACPPHTRAALLLHPEAGWRVSSGNVGSPRYAAPALLFSLLVRCPASKPIPEHMSGTAHGHRNRQTKIIAERFSQDRRPKFWDTKVEKRRGPVTNRQSLRRVGLGVEIVSEQ